MGRVVTKVGCWKEEAILLRELDLQDADLACFPEMGFGPESRPNKL